MSGNLPHKIENSMNKISIIGAGRVGETAAHTLAQQEACSEITLLDIREGAAAGAALDIMQSASYFGFDTRVTALPRLGSPSVHQRANLHAVRLRPFGLGGTIGHVCRC